MATDTIDYVATDTWGNTATSTRVVIIQASPSIAPTNDALTASSFGGERKDK
jgi:3-methyladenine DNA glycosylase AlkC